MSFQSIDQSEHYVTCCVQYKEFEQQGTQLSVSNSLCLGVRWDARPISRDVHLCLCFQTLTLWLSFIILCRCKSLFVATPLHIDFIHCIFLLLLVTYISSYHVSPCL